MLQRLKQFILNLFKKDSLPIEGRLRQLALVQASREDDLAAILGLNHRPKWEEILSVLRKVVLRASLPNECDACKGTGKTLGLQDLCMCGGSGLAIDAVEYLRKELNRIQDEGFNRAVKDSQLINEAVKEAIDKAHIEGRAVPIIKDGRNIIEWVGPEDWKPNFTEEDIVKLAWIAQWAENKTGEAPPKPPSWNNVEWVRILKVVLSKIGTVQ